MKAHAPGKNRVARFLLLLAVLVGYFVYLTLEYDIATGGVVSVLTWSFFVLCTPVADAGALLDFPIRLLFGVRMMISELFVWGIAISVNVAGMYFFAPYYDKTFLTSLLRTIVTTPYPYWAIILLSCLGTFLSLWFGDEVVDDLGDGKGRLLRRIRWRKLLVLAAVFAVVVAVYVHLLGSLGITF